MRKPYIRNRYFSIFDVAICFFAYFIVYLLIHPFGSTFSQYMESVPVIILTVTLYLASMGMLSIYHTDWIHAGSVEYVKLIAACFGAALLSVIIVLKISIVNISVKMNIAANVCIIVGICAGRFTLRLLYNLFVRQNNSNKKRVLVIGAGQLAVAFLRDVVHNETLNYEIVGLIDDDKNKYNLHLCGTKVIGTRADIERICKSMNVEEIIFAIYSLNPVEKTAILDICSKTGKRVKILQGMAANINDIGVAQKFRDINIEDLLERDPILLDNSLIEEDISEKVVLVTGAGGSIGSELCRQIIKYKPAKLIILDIYENSLYDLQNELEEEYPEQQLITLIASVRDKKRLDFIFEKYNPEIVFHAAAHKHVPLMEDSPCEAIKNNVLGTYNSALCAKEFNAKRFVLISTDKAVNPTNVMGASKRMCEMIIQTLQKCSSTEFVAVRFGNVLGSNGSVIPRFKKQIEKGGPVTVTHVDITRFFMTIPEAAQLVLQAASYAKGGEIFVLDMGSPVKIYDLAKKMIRLSGYKPDVDIKIQITGLRPGEKLYEELLMSEEGLKKTSHSKIFVGKLGDLSIEQLDDKIDRLKSVVTGDDEEVKRVIAEVVPTYKIYRTKEKNLQLK